MSFDDPNKIPLVNPAIGAGGGGAGSFRYSNAEAMPVDILPGTCQGRITLDASAVPDEDVTGAATLYLRPYKGDRVSIFDPMATDAGWRAWIIPDAGLSLDLDTSIVADTNYDVFIGLDSAQNLYLTLEPWDTDTARFTGELGSQDGVPVSADDAGLLYLGTIRTDASAEMEDSVQNRFVWNMYNRIRRAGSYLPGGGSWTVHNSTFRGLNNNASGWRFSLVQGLNEEDVEMTLVARLRTGDDGVNLRRPEVSIGLDSTTAKSTDATLAPVREDVSGTVNYYEHGTVLYAARPGLGFHYLHCIERAGTGGASSAFVDAQVVAGSEGYGAWRAAGMF